MSIDTGKLDGSIVSPPRVLLVFLVAVFGVESERQPIVHQVDTVCITPKTCQQVGAFDISMDVLGFVEKLQPFQLERELNCLSVTESPNSPVSVPGS